MVRRTLPLLLLAALLAPGARAGDRDPAHLIFRPRYADALLEGRVRNVPVFVSRHKDECGRCRRQYERVLTNPDFVRWANEHLVVLISHNEMLHEAVEVELEDGTIEERCPLYPGMTCREHVHAAVDVDNGRGEGLVRIEFVELCPNSWLVLPDEQVSRIPEEDQFDPRRIRALVEERQVGLGRALSRPDGLALMSRFEACREAREEEDWHAALKALAAVAARAPEPSASLRRLVDQQLAGLEEDVVFAAADVLEAQQPGPEERKTAREILEAVDVPVYGSYLPVRARLLGVR